MNPSTRGARLFAGLLVVSAISGCSIDQQQGAAVSTVRVPEIPAGTPSVVAMPDQISRPMDQYLPTAAELVAIERDRIRRVNGCLAGRGERGQLKEGPDLEAFAVAVVRDRRVRSDLYGFFDPTAPATYGYANPPTIPATYSEAPEESLPPEPLAACQEVADQQVDGLGLTMESSLLPGGGPRSPTTDSRFTTAASNWSACMTARKFAYPDPVAAISDAKWRHELSGPSADQKATAAADISCKQETNLVGIATNLQSAYDRVYIAANQPALEALRDRYAITTRP